MATQQSNQSNTFGKLDRFVQWVYKNSSLMLGVPILVGIIIWGTKGPNIFNSSGIYFPGLLTVQNNNNTPLSDLQIKHGFQSVSAILVILSGVGLQILLATILTRIAAYGLSFFKYKPSNNKPEISRGALNDLANLKESDLRKYKEHLAGLKESNLGEYEKYKKATRKLGLQLQNSIQEITGAIRGHDLLEDDFITYDAHDQIHRLLENWSDDKNAPALIRQYGKKTFLQYSELLNKSISSSAMPNWQQLNKWFLKLFFLCKEAQDKTLPKPLNIKEESIKEFLEILWYRHQQLSVIIRYDMMNRFIHSTVIPCFTLVMFLIVSICWNLILGIDPLNNQGALGYYLDEWQWPIILILSAFCAYGFIKNTISDFAYWLTEKTWTDIDDIIVGSIIGPTLVLVMAALIITGLSSKITPSLSDLWGSCQATATCLDILMLNIAFNIDLHTASIPIFSAFIKWLTYITLDNTFYSLIAVALLTWLAVFILNRIIVTFLGVWAEKTEQKYDDVFVLMLQVFGTFVILAFGFGAILSLFNEPIHKATGVDSILLPYSIVISVFTAILGYASRAGFENFFGGLLLQIEKPFKIGERIILPDGKICDVRELGMRSTVLYNVLENTEVSVPNSVMSTLIISNASRPDLEIRVAISVWILPRLNQLEIAQKILLDIAYLEEEVDQMRIYAGELPDEAQIRAGIRRATISEEFQKLPNNYERIRTAKVYKITGGAGQTEGDRVFAPSAVSNSEDEPYNIVLSSIRALRERYDEVDKRSNAHFLLSLENIGYSKHKASYTVRIFKDSIIDMIPAVIDDEKAYSREFDKVCYAITAQTDLSKTQIETLINECPGTEELTTIWEKVAKIKKDLLDSEYRRRGIVFQIHELLATLGDFVFAIAEQFPEIRSDLKLLVNELNKEPIVFSTYNADGTVTLMLNCHTLYLERRYEVIHKLNRSIERQFHRAGIEYKIKKP